ncbi:WSC domain-containing protein [Botrytis cinerea]
MAPPIFLLAILLSFLSLTTLTFAQTSTTPASTTSTVIPTIVPSASSYTYVGCYNETLNTNTTGGLRSLNGGVTEALDVMTIPLCMAFCKSNGYAYAGIEYTRECYCAQYLSALAPKVDDAKCDLPCKGNASQICGGSWTLSVYLQDGSQKGGAGRGGGTSAGKQALMALGVTFGGFLAFC